MERRFEKKISLVCVLLLAIRSSVDTVVGSFLVIQTLGLKGHSLRALKLKPSTLTMLKRYLAEHTEEYPFRTRKAVYDAWGNYRGKLAKRL